MANFANPSDAISVIRADIGALMVAYRILQSDITTLQDFDRVTATLTPGIDPLVDADFVGENDDYATAAAFYTDLIAVKDILAGITGPRRKALSRLSPR